MAIRARLRSPSHSVDKGGGFGLGRHDRDLLAPPLVPLLDLEFALAA